MTASKRPQPYHAFMLRMWQERSDAQYLPDTWRYSLEDPHTGKRFGFSSLTALIAFLEVEMATNEGDCRKHSL